MPATASPRPRKARPKRKARSKRQATETGIPRHPDCEPIVAQAPADLHESIRAAIAPLHPTGNSPAEVAKAVGETVRNLRNRIARGEVSVMKGAAVGSRVRIPRAQVARLLVAQANQGVR